MEAYRHANGRVRLMESTAGEDLTDWTPVDLPSDYDAETHVFDAATDSFVPDLTALDAMLHDRIDREAGKFRLNFITDVPGQQAVYLAKEEEARNWTIASLPGSAPYLEAEAAARGITVAAMAAMILAISADWKALSVAIEARRIGAKEAVTAAQTVEEKRLAADVDWAGLI